MFNPFQPIELIQATVYSAMPDKFRIKQRTAWSDHNRQGQEVDSFIEGPSFDKEGNLWIVDIPFGRIFKINAQQEWELVIQYDGWPNGLKFHQDGRIFITDYLNGIMVLDPKTKKIEPLIQTVYSESFKGVNDLHFAANGDLYFTDQGQTGMADPSGRVFRLRADGQLEKLLSNGPSPNGITYNEATRQVFVAMTRAQQIWRLPLMADGQPSKVGVAIQLSGGVGPDGIELDSEGGLVVSHLGMGVWRFDANGLPTHLITGPNGNVLTNLAFGGKDKKTLFMTDSHNGAILSANLPVSGKVMFG
jgi:gluconolactonase